MRDAVFFFFANNNHNKLATKNHKHPIVGNKIDPCRKIFSRAKLFSHAGSASGKLFSHAGGPEKQ